MNKTTEVFESKNSNYSSTSVERALKLAEEHFSKLFNKVMMQGNLGHQWTGLTLADGCNEALAAIREALAEPKCSDHPDAPHGFDRNASHSAGRYVCECEGWSPEPVKQSQLADASLEPVAWHHPECEGECIACLIERCVEDSYGKQGVDYMLRRVNAAPVGAEHFLKAIAALREGIATCRAEALEEAAKWFEGYDNQAWFELTQEEAAAAIRKLK